MKHILYVISVFLVATVLASCVDSEAMRQRLSYVSQCNRADTVFTEAWLPTVDSLVNYFDHHGNANEKMMAHYLKGRVHHDIGDAPQALACYRDATNAADTTSKDCDFKTLSRVYGQMGTLFLSQRIPEKGKEAFLMARKNAFLDKDTLSSLIFYSRVSNIYHMENLLDSALWICLYTDKELKKLGYQEIAASYILTAYDIYIRRGDLVKAKKCLDEYEHYSGYVDKHGNVKKGLEGYYYFKGKYNEEINRLDSAIFFYRKLLNYCKENKDLLEYSFSGMLSAYSKIGLADSVKKYAVLFAEANDSSTIRHSSEETIRMLSLYNYNEKQMLVAQKTLETEKYKNVLYLIIGIGILSLIVSGRIWKLHEQRNREKLLSWNKKYFETLTKYHDVKSDLQLSYNNLEQYKVEKEKEIEELRKSLSIFVEAETNPEVWNLELIISSAVIVKRMHKLACKAKQPSEVEWDELRQLLHKHLPSFYLLIMDVKYGLSNNEQKAAMLIRLRFIPTELMALLNLSKQRITNIRSNINNKVFHVKGTKDLDANLMRL